MNFHIWHQHRDLLRKAGLSKKSEKYVASFIDHIIYAIALISPIMTIPQVVKIFAEQNASGVSAMTWLTYVITSAFWVFYGILHNEKPIIYSNILWVFLSFLIVIGTMIYG